MATKAVQFNDNIITYDDTKYKCNEYIADNNFFEIVNLTTSLPHVRFFVNGLAHWIILPAANKRVRETNGGFTITLD